TTTSTAKTTTISGNTTSSVVETTSDTTITTALTTKPKTTTSTAKTTIVSGNTTSSVVETTSDTTITTTSTTKPKTTTVTTTISTTISTGTTISTKSVYNGIDVSTYQGLIDWNKAKADGLEFGIMRAGYGKYASQEDRYFKTNMKNAKAAGVPCGAYWFSYALTPQEAIQEADAFYTVIKDYKMEYPVSFDMETGDQSNLSKAQVSAIIDAFCSRMESYGYYVTLYSYASFLNSKVSDEIFEKYDIWVAHYGVSSPSFYRNYGLWQYSSTGSVAGISGPVDRDYAYLPYEAIIKENHFNGY
ncbi:MAG: glycoside hydrolase family 25 protein, partial [Ruminococcus sp.]|nr:glycoside hydrolase family 25 protein [Ruminococcus sp.]